ncbi:MAG: outer membrane protein assembly factor BamD [Persephonella sp.]|nr:MAG: outer membrane protein assembly factor BamD [Persephonella sp.]
MKKAWLILVGLVLIVSSCSKPEYFVDKKVYYRGIELYKKGEYDDAKDYLKEAIYKAKGLTTEELMYARYYLANIYYKDENYVDAIVEFEEFLSLFPTSPLVPEVLYKLADSYLKVSPDPDRDLTYSEKALEKAEELVSKYPNSKYTEKAKEIIKKVKEIEIKHYENIAYLYNRLGKYYSSARYYQYILDEYSNYVDKDRIKLLKAKNLLKVKYQYEDEIKEINEKIKEIDRKIREAKNPEEKKVLQNRKKLYKKHLDKLLNRIREGKREAIQILNELSENSKYKYEAKNLLREVK